MRSSSSQIIKTTETGIYSDELAQLDFLNYNNTAVSSSAQQASNMHEINQQLNQTRSQRIRAAMFPESLEDYGYIQAPSQTGNLMNLNQPPSAVQRLSQPCQVQTYTYNFLRIL